MKMENHKFTKDHSFIAYMYSIYGQENIIPLVLKWMMLQGSTSSIPSRLW